jgi:hypothetical protein
MRTDSVLAVFIRTSRAAQGIGLPLTHIVIAILAPMVRFWPSQKQRLAIITAIPAIWLFRWD